jgi:hypothetical protein
MKRSSGPRKTANLSESVHRQLNAFALAATAGGVGLLALAQPSEAKIIYTKTYHVIDTNGNYPLDLNHDGTVDFVIQDSSASRQNFLLAKTPYGNGVEGIRDWADALEKGAPINRRQTFMSSNGLLRVIMADAVCTDTGCGSGGSWLNVNGRYLGLKFRIKGKIHYGWARLNVHVDRVEARITATVTGYAYETIPGKPIVAGQTKGPDDARAEESSATPMPTRKPATLGALAMGAPGLSIWRREESGGVVPQE